MKATRVMTRAAKQYGTEYPAQPTEYLVDIVKGKSIQIFREDKDGTVNICRKFVLGDIAEYDSYNLSYTGVIDSITDKSITITAYKGSNNEKKHRLDLNKFCWRNYKFDLAKTMAENAETSMYI